MSMTASRVLVERSGVAQERKLRLHSASDVELR